MNSTPTAPQDIVLDIKKLQAGQVEIRNTMMDMRQDIRAMKDEMVSFKTIMGEFMKTDARREGDYLHLVSRGVERIEHRLDIQDQPPA
jgi:hypothetical protein